MIVSTTDNVPGREIGEILGLARGNTVRARNIGKDIFAGFNLNNSQIKKNMGKLFCYL